MTSEACLALLSGIASTKFPAESSAVVDCTAIKVLLLAVPIAVKDFIWLMSSSIKVTTIIGLFLSDTTPPLRGMEVPKRFGELFTVIPVGLKDETRMVSENVITSSPELTLKTKFSSTGFTLSRV